MSNFDIASLAVQGAGCASNLLRVDDTGMPSVMVRIPKQTWKDLGIGTSTETFPAWIVNGHEIDEFEFSKFNNVVSNGRAYSWPAQDPRASITLDTSISSCSAKGEGWHEMTRLEWMAIALWCKQNGFMPKGNNNYGKDHSETIYKAIPATYESDGRTAHVLTGTGPLSWSHNGEPDGIWDMNGNVWEWTGGMRMVEGEIQVISHDGKTFGNDAADTDNSQSANSALWRAINADGVLVEPGSANTLKVDWVSNHWRWIKGTITTKESEYHSHLFENVDVEEGISEAAIHILQALGLYKVDTASGAYQGDYIGFNNSAAERCFYCGGRWASGAGAGLFSLYGLSARSTSHTYVGLRSAYVKLPTA